MPAEALRRPSIPARVADYIFYYYSKLVIAPSAGQAGNYRFIMDRYKQLASGALSMSRYDREIEALRSTRCCAYCGRAVGLEPAPVVPPCLGGPLGLHNMVLTCNCCRAGKADKDFVSWWLSLPGHDLNAMPRLPIGLYLKLAYERHQIAFTLAAPCHDVRELFASVTPA